MKKIEFRIPIIATDHFFSNIKLAALSLQRLGPPYSGATIKVYVGDKADMDFVVARNVWANSFPIEWIMVPHDRRPYLGTANYRFETSSDADVVICSDADTCLVKPIDDLVTRLGEASPVVAGLQAHVSPWLGQNLNNEEQWQRIFSHAGLEIPKLDHFYSMDSHFTMGNCPPYFNFGFVAFNNTGFEYARGRLEEFTLRVAPILPVPNYQCQIGLTLALMDAQIGIIQLSHAFNCANDYDVSPELLQNPSLVRVIHYLRNFEFDRATFLSTAKGYADFINQPKENPISELLRQHVISLGNAFLEPALT